MAHAFHVSETVERPLETVWAFLSDLGKFPQWMTGIEEARLASPGPPEEGARVTMAARGKELEVTIARFEPPHHLALSTQQRNVTMVYTYTCDADGEYTRVDLNAECFAERGIWKFLLPVVAFLIKKADGGHLRALKKTIEAGSQDSHGR